jgi:broad specificity phosphatase PhoE
MKIILVRHGEVEEAYHKCYNGHIDISLSKKGNLEAKSLAETFKESKFDRVYCSDLKRTKETLKPFKQKKQAIYTEHLREKSWGKHEGMSFKEIIEEGQFEYENFLQWINALGGENYNSYIERVRKFFLDFLLKENLETVLVVTHAGVIRSLISIVNKLSLEESFSIDIPYGSYTLFDTKKMSFSKVKYKTC